MLGTSLGTTNNETYTAITKTSFGADTSDSASFFTGKPYVEDLGYAFLFRNYRADMGKWLSQDLIGYPDGWNNFAYCENNSVFNIDLFGSLTVYFRRGTSIVTDASQLSPTDGLNNEAGPTGLTITQSANHKITVAINVVLSINSNTPKNDSYAVGSEIEYIPHSNSMTDSSMTPGVYEAILAHERAHLQQFINYKSSLEINLQNQLRELGINEDRELTSQELSNLADILRVTMNNFYYGNPARLISIARSANAPTISTLTSLGWSNIGENKWKKLE